MLPWLRFLIHFYVQCLDHVDILIAFFCRTHIHIYRWFQAERKGGREEGWEVRKVVLESIDKDKEAMVGPAGHVFQNMLSSDHYDSWTQALR